MSTETKTARLARVGTRLHLVPGMPEYVGQPEVALCGTVFIRQSPPPVDPPACYDCRVREVDRLQFLITELLDEADELESTLVRHDATRSGA